MNGDPHSAHGSASSAPAAFRALHESGCFVLPNPWDIGSAVYLHHLGFKALATTSAGFAFSRALPDSVSSLSVDAVLAHIGEIVAATALPVNADFQYRIIDTVDQLIPAYSSNPADAFAGGNVAVCIIDGSGRVHGNIWGTDKIRGRQFFRLAWTKASQVWITGMKTGEYEKKLFNGEFDESLYGIQKPDLIGWEGGQPISLADGTILSVGFSGFRGVNDLDIVVRAIAEIERNP